MDQVTLIEQTKKIAGLRTDTELAKALGVSKQTISTWKTGRSWPDATQAAQIAVLQGREPLAGVAAIEMARHGQSETAITFWQAQLRKCRELIFSLRDTSATKMHALGV